jgi:CIC family chloride channel protein
MRRQALRAQRTLTRAALTIWDRVLLRLSQLGLDENALLLTFAVASGLAAAGGVVVFYRAIDLAHFLLFVWPEAMLVDIPISLSRPLLTAIAFASAAALWKRHGDGTDGMTVPDVQLAVVRRGGRIPSRPAAIRTLASAITIGGGGSAGSEGPVAVIGAAAGSFFGRLFRFSPDRIRVLVGSGAAAGIAAAFNAPLAGAFFALEEVLGSFRTTTFAPVVVASVVGAVVARWVFGNHPAFPIPKEFGATTTTEVVLLFPLLGVVCGLVSALFVRVHFAISASIKRAVREHRTRAAMLPWISGAVVGTLVLLSNGLVVGSGHIAIPLAAFGRMAWWLLLALSLGKILVTSLTLHGGGSGGLFTPSLFVGATLGGAFGVALRDLLPALGAVPEAYALVAMGAVVAAATGANITAILLVFEMTGDYAIVPPLMVAVVISSVVARRVERDNLYTGWLRRRGEHLRHGSDRDVLSGLLVADAYEREAVVVRESEPVHQLLQHLGSRDQSVFPVVDDDSRLIGVLTMIELGAVARAEHALDHVVVASDVVQPSEVVAPDDSLLEAVRRMGVRGIGSLPVVDPESERVLGVVHRAGILARYERALEIGHDTAE